jgi:fructose-1,6-bisphosphatase/inositol monophosphatase family enzyme
MNGDLRLLAPVAGLMRRVAETEILPRWRNLSAADCREKAPGDWVTIADESAERALRAGLQAIMAADTVGEEETASDPSVLDRLGNDRPAWIIDPVDGTWHFREGSDEFGMLVALAEAGRVRAGWLLRCTTDDVIAAAAGGGAWTVSRAGALCRLPLPAPTGLGTASHSFFPPGAPWTGEGARLTPRGCPPARRATSSCVDYMTLSTGGSLFNIASHSKAWDHAAGTLAVRELGGSSLTLDGRTYDIRRTTGGVASAFDPAVLDAVRGSYLDEAGHAPAAA